MSERLAADSGLVSEIRPSPNHDERRGRREPDALVLHYTGMPTAEGALARLTDPASSVSAHYVVHEDGRVVQLVAERRRAWHAGAGSWQGDRDMNSCSIGIEIVHPGHDGGLPPYLDAQIEAVIALSQDILTRWPIPAGRVIAHSDMAPDRKEDPGEVFPWDRLARAGIGRWIDAAPPGPALLGRDARGEAVSRLQEGLGRFGYGLTQTGSFDAETQLTVIAFQRHYRPARVDGCVDGSTLAALTALLAGG